MLILSKHLSTDSIALLRRRRLLIHCFIKDMTSKIWSNFLYHSRRLRKKTSDLLYSAGNQQILIQ